MRLSNSYISAQYIFSLIINHSYNTYNSELTDDFTLLNYCTDIMLAVKMSLEGSYFAINNF